MTLEPDDTYRLASLCGPLDQHIQQISRHFAVHIEVEGNNFKLSGGTAPVQTASKLLKQLYGQTLSQPELTSEEIHLSLQESHSDCEGEDLVVRMRHCQLKLRGANQAAYIKSIREQDVTLGIGPAGTGKTYLAVAAAVVALERQQVSRILLVRPAVEAGEKLGFLPGDLAQKIDPYVQPLFDALFDMMGRERAIKLIEQRTIEVAPLAYMRGRTLSHAFVILDEGQNTSVAQMKMFLTRIGFGSTVVVTGDVTQMDLPAGQLSGLKHGMKILAAVSGVRIVCFTTQDIARHPLVKRIVDAYEAHE